MTDVTFPPEPNGSEKSKKSSDEYGFPCVPAQYSPHRIARYAHNPLISAINHDFPTSAKALAKKLTVLPDFSPEQRQLDGHTRRQLIKQLLRMKIGMPRLVELAESVHSTMLEGYMGREPHTPGANSMLHTLFMQQKSKSRYIARAGRSRNSAQFTSAVIGTPGSGKSFSLCAVSEMYEPVIHHEDIGLYQIPTLLLEMPARGASIGTLAHAIIYELDRLFPLGEYARLYLGRRANHEQLLLAAFALLHTHAVGYVIVDEAQNKDYERAAEAKRKKQQTPLATTLITMSNQMQIPLLFSGTAETRDSLGGRMSLLRRTVGNGLRHWGPLSIDAAPGKKSEYDQFMDVMWGFNWLREPTPLTAHMRKLFYAYTGAVPDVVVKLFHGVQWRALQGGEEQITEQLVHDVANNELADVIEVIAAVAQRHVSVLAREVLRDISDLAAEYNIPAEEPFSDVVRGPKKAEVNLVDQMLTDLGLHRGHYSKVPGGDKPAERASAAPTARPAASSSPANAVAAGQSPAKNVEQLFAESVAEVPHAWPPVEAPAKAPTVTAESPNVVTRSNAPTEAVPESKPPAVDIEAALAESDAGERATESARAAEAAKAAKALEDAAYAAHRRPSFKPKAPQAPLREELQPEEPSSWKTIGNA